jgi:hypothetical protein
MDHVHWIYLAVIASALLLLFGATGLVMFTDRPNGPRPHVFRGADTK